VTPDDRIIVSRPTFAELGDVLTKAGRLELFNDNGDIEVGSLTIHTESDVPQTVRAAVGIDEAASRPHSANGDAIYDDGEVAFYTQRRHDGVHLTERRNGLDPHIVIMPRNAVTPVAGELIECLLREPG
jgi:hypothetical protein